MSWLTRLYETYNNCAEKYVGKEEETAEGEKTKRPLLPGYHTTKKADIEITIDKEGNFVEAGHIPKNLVNTVISCTEKSASRTRGSEPHPLNDTLEYIAGDLPEYYNKYPKDKYQDYYKQLDLWQNSPYATPKVKAIFAYIQKKQVVADLLTSGVLFKDENNKLVDGDKTVKYFCRFCVNIANEKENRTYKDEGLYTAWINYCDSLEGTPGLCYVSGETNKILAQSHAKFIRNTGCGGKLISVNDTINFTFRGMFTEASQACAVSSEVSQKAHAALKWLIDRQAYQKNGHCILAWTTAAQKVPNPIENDFDEYDEENQAADNPADTAQNYAQRLAKAALGYRQNIADRDKIIILALDAATPGRLSLIYYREMGGGEYFERLLDWYNTCSWVMKISSKKDKNPKKSNKEKNIQTEKYYYLIGTPSPNEIVEAVYGINADAKLKHTAIERLLPCIVESRPIPVDMVKGAVVRTSNRIGYQTKDWDENEFFWNRALQTTCAIYKKANHKEGYTVSLDEERTSREYLYGRLLAVADQLEGWALKEDNANRPTAAARYFAKFATSPFATWKTIEESLQTYLMKLGGKATNYTRLLDEIMSKFEAEDYLNNKPLSGEYLLGYHNQRQVFNEARQQAQAKKNNPNQQVEEED